MKLKQTIILSIFAIAGLTSCEKNLYEPNQEEPATKKVEDLKIADNFDWKASKDAACKITTTQATTLSIYQDEACSTLLATTSVTPDKEVKLPLSILKDTQKLYVKVDGENKVYSASVSTDGQINFSVPSSTRAITRAKDDFEDRGTTLFYPNGNWGTVMFEDNYPIIGDYDFNDFVATYMIEVHTYPNTSYIKSIQFYMTVQAIGANGYFGYIPHLRIKSFENSLVQSMEVNKKGMDNLEVKRFSDGKSADEKTGKIVLAFNGAEDKKGQTFFNTEEGEPYIPGSKFDVTLNFAIEAQADLAFIYADMFDIFLANKDCTKEIHMSGYGPAFTSDYTDYENKNYYKQAGTNLVWGINIPTTIGHTYEKANFLEAYPRFADWAQGNGANDWYNNGNSKYLFPIY